MTDAWLMTSSPPSILSSAFLTSSLPSFSCASLPKHRLDFFRQAPDFQPSRWATRIPQDSKLKPETFLLSLMPSPLTCSSFLSTLTAPLNLFLQDWEGEGKAPLDPPYLPPSARCLASHSPETDREEEKLKHWCFFFLSLSLSPWRGDSSWKKRHFSDGL